MKKIVAIIIFSCIVNTASSQWSADPTINEEVSSYTSSVILTSPTSTGGTFISMYKPNGSNFDMVVQYINAAGVKQFGSDGIILTSYPANSATFVYNVMTDAQDNFIIAFQDQRSASFSAVAYKINTAGQSLWETTPGTGDGLLLGVGLAPYPCQLSNGDYIFAWSNTTNNKIDYQKVTAAGALAWGSALEINPIIAGRQITRPQLVAHTGGKWGMVFQQRNGTVGNPLPSTLYEKQFDSDGNTLWTSNPLSNYVTATVRYYSVTSLADVTYIGYYANPNLQNRFDGFVQRVDGDGSLPWGINGSDFSTEQVNYEMNITIVYNAILQEVWAVQSFTDINQVTYGIYTQRFAAATGARQLTDNAKELIPLSANREQTWPTSMGLCSDGSLMFMFYSDVTNNIYATKIDANGNFIWPVWPVTRLVIAGTANTKARYNFSVAADIGVAVWQENRSGNTLAYAQNVNCMGVIGPLAVHYEYFTGTKNGNNHILNWKVYAENSAKGTMILQQSADARNFKDIYSITATPVQMLQSFSYANTQLLKGINYYRLKMIDDNGMITYTSIVALSNADKGFDVISITPNPVMADGNFKYNISAAERLKMTIVITDITGRVVLKQNQTLIAGFNAIDMKVANLASGTYQVYGITGEGRTKVMGFVKE
ncbi:T9SS type A sorting domain-containing protein [Ferruginibacter sp. SUN106]|uniref:T9SS type A sorting domain-containing protein n=1 Tax=Ferruginibacter sp. SUN106 TaxID=2978348 RepID=UPI003D366370